MNTAGRAAQTCTDGGAVAAAQAVADHRATGCTDTAADRRLLNVQELDARPTFNSFRGTYVGDDLIDHLHTIDPDQSHFTYVSDYINAFPESKCFFEYFFPYFHPILERQQESLWELNLQLLTICLKLLRRPVKLTFVENQEITGEIIDLRGKIEPKGTFEKRSYYRTTPYPQLFGVDFEPNLSILDLLFCVGPEAEKVLKQSLKKP